MSVPGALGCRGTAPRVHWALRVALMAPGSGLFGRCSFLRCSNVPSPGHGFVATVTYKRGGVQGPKKRLWT